jgi:predicted RNase H-like HicB family nuclease
MTYRVHSEWDPCGVWVTTCPEVPNAVTQSKRLDLVPADAAELLSLATGTEVTSDDIVVGSGPRQANSRPRPNAPRGCTDTDQLDEWVAAPWSRRPPTSSSSSRRVRC